MYPYKREAGGDVIHTEENRKRFEDAGLEDERDVATSHGMPAAPGSWGRRGTDSLGAWSTALTTP